MFVLATVRFCRTAGRIDSHEEERPILGSRLDIALAGLLSLMGISLFFYLSRIFIVA